MVVFLSRTRIMIAEKVIASETLQFACFGDFVQSLLGLSIVHLESYRIRSYLLDSLVIQLMFVVCNVYMSS